MEIKMKIIVCGDSFCSAHNYERDHFSQILEDEYDYQVINLARGGTGNISICFQIQKAIELSADIVVHYCTGSSRIEIPVKNKPFDRLKGLKNFIYPYPRELSYGSPHVGGLDAPYFSQLLGHIIETDPEKIAFQDQYVKLSKELREAVRMYAMFIHDVNLKAITDNWAREYWESKLVQAEILSIPFETVGNIAYEFAAKNLKYPKCYHTDRVTQEIIAKNVHEKIKGRIFTMQHV